MTGFLEFLQSISVIPNHTPVELWLLFISNLLGTIIIGLLLGQTLSQEEGGYEIR